MKRKKFRKLSLVMAVILGIFFAGKLPVYAAGTKVYMEIADEAKSTEVQSGQKTVKTGDKNSAAWYLISAGIATILIVDMHHKKRKYSEIKEEC